MTFYVYKAIRERRKVTWELVSEHEDLPEAETAATALCPRKEPVYTEPGHGLNKSFFGSAQRDRWAAMIVTDKRMA